jgi:hypothetical protein
MTPLLLALAIATGDVTHSTPCPTFTVIEKRTVKDQARILPEPPPIYGPRREAR